MRKQSSGRAITTESHARGGDSQPIPASIHTLSAPISLVNHLGRRGTARQPLTLLRTKTPRTIILRTASLQASTLRASSKQQLLKQLSKQDVFNRQLPQPNPFQQHVFGTRLFRQHSNSVYTGARPKPTRRTTSSAPIHAHGFHRVVSYRRWSRCCDAATGPCKRRTSLPDHYG